VKFIQLPDSWRRSKLGGGLGHHTEQLLPHVRLGSTEDEAEQASEKRDTESRSERPNSSARGLAIQIDAHGSWRKENESKSQ
jgi:hypothetical protein